MSNLISGKSRISQTVAPTPEFGVKTYLARILPKTDVTAPGGGGGGASLEPPGYANVNNFSTKAVVVCFRYIDNYLRRVFLLNLFF